MLLPQPAACRYHLVALPLDSSGCPARSSLGTTCRLPHTCHRVPLCPDRSSLSTTCQPPHPWLLLQMLDYPGRPVLATVDNNTACPKTALLEYLPPVQTQPFELLVSPAPAGPSPAASRPASPWPLEQRPPQPRSRALCCQPPVPAEATIITTLAIADALPFTTTRRFALASPASPPARPRRTAPRRATSPPGRRSCWWTRPLQCWPPATPCCCWRCCSCPAASTATM